MKKNDIIIDEQYCKGCGFCVDFCPKDCIILHEDKFNSQGFAFSSFENSENCNACGICSFMCPHHAIEVYKYIE